MIKVQPRRRAGPSQGDTMTSDDVKMVAKYFDDRDEDDLPDYEDFCDSEESKSHRGEGSDSEDSNTSMELYGNKFGLTKTCMRGTYDFQFLRDPEFLAKSFDEQKKFVELQMELRQRKQLMKTRHEN